MTETAHSLLLAQQGERLALLDTREADHWAQLGSSLTDLGNRLSGLAGTLADHTALLGRMDGVADAVLELQGRLDEIAPIDDDAQVYRQAPSPQWWIQDWPEREERLDHIAAWVREIFRPGYGHLAGMLGQCWRDHPLCLYILDLLCESWSVLYLQGDRSQRILSGQLEWETRILPSMAEQMGYETSRCEHQAQANGRTRRV